MSLAYIDKAGATHQVELNEGELLAMVKTGNPVAEINKKYIEADPKYGTAFDQFKASVGLIRPERNNPLGLRAANIGDIMDGKTGFSASNSQQNTSPFGTAARAFVNIAIIQEVTSEVQKDRTTDMNTFDSMVALDITLDSEHFERPVIDYTTLDGPEQTKASRVVQGATPPKMMFFKTAQRIHRIGAWNIGMEWTDQALKNTTLDYVALTMGHYLQVERDERVYRYLGDLFNGNNDLIANAVASVTSNSLDSNATGGVLTHKAWVKFLARNRKYRKITHLICDIDTYLKIESRTGRPGSNAYDPRLAVIDPQVQALNVGFGNDVKFFLVDSAVDGGPVPANTIWAIDASSAIARVTNTSAAYSATEQYAMKRTQALRMDWAEEVMRVMGDTDLRPFDSLVLS